jgi:hypothetical protein
MTNLSAPQKVLFMKRTPLFPAFHCIVAVTFVHFSEYERELEAELENAHENAAKASEELVNCRAEAGEGGWAPFSFFCICLSYLGTQMVYLFCCVLFVFCSHLRKSTESKSAKSACDARALSLLQAELEQARHQPLMMRLCFSLCVT